MCFADGKTIMVSALPTDLLGGGSKVSLRVGHAAGLTSHRDVIQHRVAASLPRPTMR